MRAVVYDCNFVKYLSLLLVLPPMCLHSHVSSVPFGVGMGN